MNFVMGVKQKDCESNQRKVIWLQFQKWTKKNLWEKAFRSDTCTSLKKYTSHLLHHPRQGHSFERATTPKLIKTKKIQKRKDFGRRNPKRGIFLKNYNLC